MKHPRLHAALAALVLLAPSVASADEGHWIRLLEIVSAVQHVPLPAACRDAVVRVEPLRRRIGVEASCADRRLAAALRTAVDHGTLCDTVVTGPEGVALTCTTNRLHAVVRAGGLDLLQLRGLPWVGAHDAPPVIPMGRLVGAGPEFDRAEALLAAGDGEGALAVLSELRPGPRPSWTTLRRADAELACGRVAEALRLLRSIPHHGHVGRLGRMRLAELTGVELADDRLYDAAGMPPALEREMLLRAARRDAFLGRHDAAVGNLTRLHAASDAPAQDRRESDVVKAIVLDALERSSSDPLPALTLFVRWPDRMEGPLALPLVRAASERAEQAELYAFSGSLLAAATPLVPDAALEAHLTRTVRAFDRAGDAVRADIIRTYAESRFGRRPRGAAARKTPDDRPAKQPDAGLEKLVREAEVTTRLADAILTRARARRLQHRASP